MDPDVRRRIVGRIRARKAVRAGVAKRIPRQVQPDRIRESYYAALASWLAPLGARVAGRLLPLVPEDVHTDAKRSMASELKGIEDAFNRSLDREIAKVEKLAKQAAERTVDHSRVEFAKQVRAAIGIQLPDTVQGKKLDSVVGGFARENVDLIKTVPERYFASLAELVSEGAMSGRRHESIAKDIVARFDVAKSDAKRIARDQVGKLLGEMNRARQVAAGVPRFVWQTSGDERVRDEHSHLNGQSFDWSDPPSEGIPGEPIQCRCGAAPDFSEAARAAA